MDNVPIQFKKVVDPPAGVLTDEQFFDMVYEKMCKLTETEPVWIAHKIHETAKTGGE
jgi:formylmethanofuran dehydrogenase subunit B